MREEAKRWRRANWKISEPLDTFTAGDVLICTKDAKGYLKKGTLYRVRDKVPNCHAYWLEGTEGVGFWANRLIRAPGQYTRTGIIHRLLRPHP